MSTIHVCLIRPARRAHCCDWQYAVLAVSAATVYWIRFQMIRLTLFNRGHAKDAFAWQPFFRHRTALKLLTPMFTEATKYQFLEDSTFAKWQHTSFWLQFRQHQNLLSPSFSVTLISATSRRYSWFSAYFTARAQKQQFPTPGHNSDSCMCRKLRWSESIYSRFWQISSHMRRNAIISTSGLKSVVAIILHCINFLQKCRNFGNLTALKSISGQFSQHVQKQPFPSLHLPLDWVTPTSYKIGIFRQSEYISISFLHFV